MKEKLNQILADRTGQPIEQIRKDTDRDNFMSAVDAENYGLIDEVMEKNSDIKA
jgi:ATP-dependent Clp protease, protease subunit